MIGNDIVDLSLNLPLYKSEDLRWMNKAFNLNEIKIISESPFPDLQLWRLWSMKEAAYKIAVKISGIRAFNPKKFEAEVIDGTEGKVISEWGIYSLHSLFDDDSVHSIATKNITPNFSFGQKNITSQDHSEEVRKSLIKDFCTNCNSIKNLTVKIIKDIPVLYSGNGPLQNDISLSHHGGFVAWAFEKF